MRKWLPLTAICCGTFMLLIDVTVVNVALPDMARSLHTSFAGLQWVVDAYALCLSALLLGVGSIADNLGLNLKVVYGGSEDAELTALKTAYGSQSPILMYFWTPHWAQAKYDLTMMKLPEVTDQCTKDAADNPDAYACGYPQDVLYKAFNENLQTKAPAAFAFLSAMQWTNDMQNGVAADIHDGMDPQDAAQKWVDANPTVWQPWVDAGMAAQGSS